MTPRDKGLGERVSQGIEIGSVKDGRSLTIHLLKIGMNKIKIKNADVQRCVRLC